MEAGGTPRSPLQTKQLVPCSGSVGTTNVRCPGFMNKSTQVREGWVTCQGCASDKDRHECSGTWCACSCCGSAHAPAVALLYVRLGRKMDKPAAGPQAPQPALGRRRPKQVQGSHFSGSS